MAYSKQAWDDLPATDTPVDSGRLDHIEQGIFDAAATADSALAAASAAAGGVAVHVVNASSNYIASANDFVKMDATSGAKTVTVPVTANKVVGVMKVDSSANPVNVVCSGSINGDSGGAQIVAQWGSAVFVGDGSNVTIESATSPVAGGGSTGGGTSGSISNDDGTLTVTTDTSGNTIIRAHTGTTSGTVMAGDDPSRTNARTPLAHQATHGLAGSDPVSLDGSQITAGHVATTHLGTGTPSSSNFLRGDGTWAVPAGGGGGGSGTAAGTSYDPTGTDLTSTDVQDAINELDTKMASTQSAAVSAIMAAGVVLAPSLLPAYSTAGRPASGASYPIYRDTTTNKIGFWDGTNGVWRDAMGTAI